MSDRCRYYWGEPEVAAAVAKLLANLDTVAIPLPLLSQHLPEQYLAVVQGSLPAQAPALIEHKIGSLLAQYARACNRNAAVPVIAEAAIC